MRRGYLLNRFLNRIACEAKPFCNCWNEKPKLPIPEPWDNQTHCSCGEEDNIIEWKWQKPTDSDPTWVKLAENNNLVTFHPYYSAGTASVRGDTPLKLNYQYYWEVKMLTETYGTDIMVGVGADEFELTKYKLSFSSLLGSSSDSYGLSFNGAVHHNRKVIKDNSHGFCRGSIIGVRLDLWLGTLEFYINRKSQGLTFYNLRRHSNLFPMMCSTAAHSTLRTIYAASWKASLMVDALKILSASVKEVALLKVPPAIAYRVKKHFWLTFPAKGCTCNCEEPCTMQKKPVEPPASECMSPPLKRRYVQVTSPEPPHE